MIANILIFIRGYLGRLEEPAGRKGSAERRSHLDLSPPSGAWEEPQGEELISRALQAEALAETPQVCFLVL
jgi:hypothetical protein